MSNGKHSKKFKTFLFTTGLLLAMGSVAGRSGVLEISFNHPPQGKICAKGTRLCPGGICVDKKEPCDGRQFLLAADYYFSRAKDQNTEKALLGLMKEQMEEFNSRARKITGLGCGPNQVECPDGSCVSNKNKCRLPNGFKEYSRVFQKAAIYYFTNAKDPEAIEELLRDRLKDFTRGSRKLTGLGCPNDMKECAGGSCVRHGRNCD
jgi:hypothetical protein